MGKLWIGMEKEDRKRLRKITCEMKLETTQSEKIVLRHGVEMARDTTLKRSSECGIKKKNVDVGVAG